MDDVDSRDGLGDWDDVDPKNVNDKVNGVDKIDDIDDIDDIDNCA